MSVSNITQTIGGKIGVGILVVAAIGVLVFEVMHFGSGDGSRNCVECLPRFGQLA